MNVRVFACALIYTLVSILHWVHNMFVFTQTFLCLYVGGDSSWQCVNPRPAVGPPVQLEGMCIDIREE